jgi:hypothetical protein
MPDDNDNPNDDSLSFSRDLTAELKKQVKLHEKQLEVLRKRRGVENEISKLLKERAAKLNQSDLNFTKDLSKGMADGAKEAIVLNQQLTAIRGSLGKLNLLNFGQFLVSGFGQVREFVGFFGIFEKEFSSFKEGLMNSSIAFKEFVQYRRLLQDGVEKDAARSLAQQMVAQSEFGKQFEQKQNDLIERIQKAKKRGIKLEKSTFVTDLLKDVQKRFPSLDLSGAISGSKRLFGGMDDMAKKFINQRPLKGWLLGAEKSFGRLRISTGGWLSILGGGISRAVAFMGGPVALAITVAIAGAVALFNWFNKIDEAADNFRKSMGFIKGQSNAIEAAAFGTYTQFRALGVKVEDFYRSISAVADVLGTARGNEGVAKAISIVSVQLGVAAKTSAEFLKSMGMVEMTSLAAQQNTLLMAAGLASANLVPLDTLMKDVSAATKSAYSFISRSATSLVKSAVSARLMGTNLQETAKTAKSILQFTSSVQDEMEASVLLGQSLNLQYARELAYRKDIKGLNEEILRVAKETNFEQLDPFAAEAVAKALGKSSDEVASMLSADKERFKLQKALTNEDVRKKLLNESMRSSWTSIKNSISSIFVDTLAPLLPAMAVILKATAFALEKIAAGMKAVAPYLNTFGGILSLLQPGGGLSGLSGVSRLFSPDSFLKIAPNVTPSIKVEPFDNRPSTSEFSSLSSRGGTFNDAASQKRHEEVLASNQAVAEAIDRQTEAFQRGAIGANVKLDSQLVASSTDRQTRFANGYGTNIANRG